MYPRGLFPADLAGGQEEGQAVGEVLLSLPAQPLADFPLDRRLGVVRHFERRPDTGNVNMSSLLQHWSYLQRQFNPLQEKTPTYTVMLSNNKHVNSTSYRAYHRLYITDILYTLYILLYTCVPSAWHCMNYSFQFLQFYLFHLNMPLINIYLYISLKLSNYKCTSLQYCTSFGLN